MRVFSNPLAYDDGKEPVDDAQIKLHDWNTQDNYQHADIGGAAEVEEQEQGQEHEAQERSLVEVFNPHAERLRHADHASEHAASSSNPSRRHSQRHAEDGVSTREDLGLPTGVPVSRGSYTTTASATSFRHEHIPPLEAPHVAWSALESKVITCHKAELLDATIFQSLLQAYAERCERANPGAMERPFGSVDVVVQGKLTSMPEQFPDAPGVYLILLSSPSDPHWQNSRGARPTWHPVFLGVTSDGESLRKRMHYYIHPKLGPGGEGAFHPKAGDYFRYKLFRKLQPRGFSVQIRYQVCENGSNLETELLARYDVAMNAAKKKVAKHRKPDIPVLTFNASTGQREWSLKAVEDFPVVGAADPDAERATYLPISNPASPGSHGSQSLSRGVKAAEEEQRTSAAREAALALLASAGLPESPDPKDLPPPPEIPDLPLVREAVTGPMVLGASGAVHVHGSHGGRDGGAGAAEATAAAAAVPGTSKARGAEVEGSGQGAGVQAAWALPAAPAAGAAQAAASAAPGAGQQGDAAAPAPNPKPKRTVRWKSFKESLKFRAKEEQRPESSNTNGTDAAAAAAAAVAAVDAGSPGRKVAAAGSPQQEPASTTPASRGFKKAFRETITLAAKGPGKAKSEEKKKNKKVEASQGQAEGQGDEHKETGWWSKRMRSLGQSCRRIMGPLMSGL